VTPQQREQVDILFSDLLEALPGDRDRALAGVVDPEVRAEVESLLQHAVDPAVLDATNAGSASFGHAVGNLMRAATDAGAFDPQGIGAGAKFGHYSITAKLGQGGMGDVYEAARDNDFHKRVALKLVRYGLDTEYAHKRFQQERQVLAGLEHPYIARLLDGGEERGIPYLVLEYVEGLPIDRYCEGAPRNDILRIFLKVCEAVDFAHRNLVIHRDLKPANILVTADGTPKLLDFGIAKLVDEAAASAPEITQTGFRVLTPQYASPEQIRGEPITTAVDIYALGLILYELLSGRRPYTFSTTSLVEADRVICEVEPPRPGVSDDLDNILLMALRKDPARRYRSVREFAEDIERSLANRPVLARPDTLMYRLNKFVRRNRLAIAAATALVIAVGGGIATTLYQARLARQRFDDVRQLANTFLFQFHDQIAGIEGTTKAREFVVQTALDYLNRLSAGAGNDETLLEELSSAYERVGMAQGYPGMPNLGRETEAMASMEKALSIRERLPLTSPERRLAMTECLIRLSHISLYQGKREYAGSLANRAIAIGGQDLGSAAMHESLSRAYSSRGEAADPQTGSLAFLSDVREAIRHQQEAARIDPKRDQRLLRTMLANGLFNSGLLNGQLEVAEEASEAMRVLYTDAKRGYYLAYLGELYASLDQPSYEDRARSQPVIREALQAVEEELRRDPNNAESRVTKSIMLAKLGFLLMDDHPEEAVAILTECRSILDDLLSRDSQNRDFQIRRARYGARLAVAYGHLGRKDLVEPLVRDALAAYPEPTLDRMSLLQLSGSAYLHLGEREEARKLLLQAVATGERMLAAAPGQLTVATNLGNHYEAMARAEPGNAAFWIGKARKLFGSFPASNTFAQLRLKRLAMVATTAAPPKPKPNPE